MNQKELNDYKKNGYIILKNFFQKRKIEKIRTEIIKLSKKKQNNHFYFETLSKSKKKVLRRIERISQNSKLMKSLISEQRLKIVLKKFTGLKKFFI